TNEALSHQAVVRTYDLTDLLGSAYGTRRFANTPILRLERAGGEGTGALPARPPASSGQGVFGGGGGGNFEEPEAEPGEFVGIETIIQIIQSTVDPESWREAGGNVGSIRPLGARLIVTQTLPAHRRLEELLASFRRTLPTALDTDATIVQVPTTNAAQW